MEKIKVCVADDNRELVGLLTEYIEGQEDMEVLGVAYNGQECLTLFKDKEPDVLLLDIIMPSFRRSCCTGTASVKTMK